MATWADLEKELATWRVAGKKPTFWWRDDDTEAPSDPLDRLLELACTFEIPIHLAVIPAKVSHELAGRLTREREVFVLQHGLGHLNHEPQGKRPSEVGETREIELQKSDLRQGWRRLQAAALPNLLPGFTPPWNSISDTTIAQLPGLGYKLVSTSHARASATPVPGLTQVNVHADPIRWKGGAKFRGTEDTLDCIVEHLSHRRLGLADCDEPTGIITHHLQNSREVWEFLIHLLERLSNREDVDWVRLSSFI